MTDVAGGHWPPERVTLRDDAQGILAPADTLLMSDEQRFSGPESERPFGMPAQRTPVVFDPETGGLRIGDHVRRVQDPSEPTQVYGAYLSLLYAVRGAKPGEQLPLRSADLEALLLIVGDDPETIEKRLIALMGCTADEAKVLGGILLRHRKKTAALGVAASLLLGGSLASGVGGTSEDGQVVQTVSADSSEVSQAPAPATSGTAISGITSPSGTSVVLAPATTSSAPAASGVSGSGSTGGGTFAAPAAPVAAQPAVAPAAPAPVASSPAVEAPAVSAPAPVEAEPVDRDLPTTPGRPIGGTVGGEDGDGSSFEEPAPVETPAPPVVTPAPVVTAPGTSPDTSAGTTPGATSGTTTGAGSDAASGTGSDTGSDAGSGTGSGTGSDAGSGSGSDAGVWYGLWHGL